MLLYSEYVDPDSERPGPNTAMIVAGMVMVVAVFEPLIGQLVRQWTYVRASFACRYRCWRRNGASALLHCYVDIDFNDVVVYDYTFEFPNLTFRYFVSSFCCSFDSFTSPNVVYKVAASVPNPNPNAEAEAVATTPV